VKIKTASSRPAWRLFIFGLMACFAPVFVPLFVGLFMHGIISELIRQLDLHYNGPDPVPVRLFWYGIILLSSPWLACIAWLYFSGAL